MSSSHASASTPTGASTGSTTPTAKGLSQDLICAGCGFLGNLVLAR